MKYRTKLYLALSGTAVVSTALGLGLAYWQVRGFFMDELRSKVMSIAATAAANLNGDLLKSIRSKQDEGSANYNAIQQQLRNIRDANRRDDIFVKFVYTVIPYPNNPDQFMFQVDAEESTPDFSHFGDDVEDAKDDRLRDHIGETFSPHHLIINHWGTWMSGFSPIYDKRGNYVATIGVDLRALDVLANLNQLITFELFALLGGIALALVSGYFLSKRETLSLQSLCAGVKEIGEGNLNERVHLHTHDEFDDLADAINTMADGLQERERLKTNFTRYVSQHIMEKILKGETTLKLEGERRKVTLLFSDIRQFTHLAEKLPPEDVVSILNSYFAVMVDVIFKHQGTLDKFLGDGMMIEFGAPLNDDLQELHAVQAAIEMQVELKKLCDAWEKEGKPTIEMGIGVHTGIAVVGNIGSEKRIDYTAIGDTVNVAARLEQLTKVLKTPILISEQTVQAVADKFPFKNLGAIPLPGRTEPIVVYSIESLPKLS